MKIIIHAHIFYVDLWKEIKEYLKNLKQYKYDLFVTIANDDEELKNDILSFNPSAKIFLVENVGFDIYPFVFFLNQVNLDDYDFIIKLHTKKDSINNTIINNYFSLKGSVWRRYLFSILEEENFEKNMLAFKSDKKLGMVGDFRLIVKKDLHDKKADKIAKAFMKEHNLLYKKNSSFVAGTMFIVRAKLMQTLKNTNLNISDFEISSSNIKGETFAHALERIFGYIVYSQGFYIDDPMHTNYEKMKYIPIKYFNIFKRFVFQVKITRNGNKIIKIFKVPIFHQTLNKNK